jgi:tetratricopeptide (TPR) repeat protein
MQIIMKRTILTMLIMMGSVVMIGQTNERTSAFNYQRMGKLDLAKQAIDKAAQHEKTIMDAKTWFYRGNIYYDIAVSIDPKYRELDPDPFGVAFQSYQKAKELDTKGEFADDIERFTVAVGEGYYNLGVIYYNEQKFKESALSFEKSFDVGKTVNRIDTSAIVNAAVASMQANDITMAKKYYEQMLQMGVQQPDVYVSLAEIYKAEGDTTLALQKVGEGRLLFPDDFNLLIAETNIYLATDEKEKAMVDLEAALQIDNTNPSIFFAVGTIYDQMGDIEKATSAYINAIRISPDYFEANYNLGALYVNQAADILDKANDLPLDAVKEYDIQKAKADEMLDKSLPYLEKSLELMPDDVNTMISLKEIYTRLGMTEKLQVINEKLKN